VSEAKSLEITAGRSDCGGDCVCTKIFLPVCDSLGHQHHNICIFNCYKRTCPESKSVVVVVVVVVVDCVFVIPVTY
jgi:hypothetical protein